MTDDRKWAFTEADRDGEFDEQYHRLTDLEVVAVGDYQRIRALWIAAKRPPIVTFIRQSAACAWRGAAA